MPELPEVETLAVDARPRLLKRTITRARVYKPDILKKRIGRPAFERGVAGRRVTAVYRRAKNLIIELDDGQRIVIQPGMTGSFQVSKSAARDPYDVIHLTLDNGAIARYHDVRRLGRVYLFSPKQWQRHDGGIGPEPLDATFTPDVLHRLLSARKLMVKKAIMDQRVLAGVGNIYANEALWIAGIDPSRESKKVTRAEAAALHQAIVDVLRRSIEGRGTTFRDYRTGTGEPGNYQGRLAVYDRAGEPCLRCGRRIAVTHAIDARSSYFCPGCQH